SRSCSSVVRSMKSRGITLLLKGTEQNKPIGPLFFYTHPTLSRKRRNEYRSSLVPCAAPSACRSPAQRQRHTQRQRTARYPAGNPADRRVDELYSDLVSTGRNFNQHCAFCFMRPSRCFTTVDCCSPTRKHKRM